MKKIPRGCLSGERTSGKNYDRSGGRSGILVQSGINSGKRARSPVSWLGRIAAAFEVDRSDSQSTTTDLPTRDHS